MKLQKISKAIIFCTILGISGNVSATPDTNEILQQQESIIQQKEQELGAKRAEAEMARQSRQQMTTLHKQTNNLAVFTLPEEQNSFKIEHFYLKADGLPINLAGSTSTFSNSPVRKLVYKALIC